MKSQIKIPLCHNLEVYLTGHFLRMVHYVDAEEVSKSETEGLAHSLAGRLFSVRKILPMWEWPQP